ncbi:MAG: response regulator transcription factor [Cyclobacteriaceae bacterium]|nr:response regulator transcription factor [Cyclobacteriaceae bacterium]
MDTLRIAVIEDDPVIRTGLLEYFQHEEFCHDAWATPSMESFFEAIKSGKHADVVLTDIGLPGMSGTDGIRLIREQLPQADVIMLTVFKDENRIFKSLCAGATGYLLKDTPFPQIKEAIRVIRNGGSFMSPAIARKVVQYFNPQPQENENNLTVRERQIIQGLVDGLSYKLIADRLSISIDTIRYHIKKIYNKMHVNSRTELIRKSMR